MNRTTAPLEDSLTGTDAASAGDTDTAGATTPLGAALCRALDGRWAAVRHEARRHLPGAELLMPDGLDLTGAREHTSTALGRLVAGGYGRDGFPEAVGGGADLGASVVSFEMLAATDLSVTVKAGVHFGLYGGAIVNLGTQRHHERYLPGVLDLSTPGCFAMTELGHGSNVQRLETTATYDPATGCFDLHSPTPSATKAYIGGAARDAVCAVVFAQLRTPSAGGGHEEHGVHALVVRLREQPGGPTLPGITASDHGTKGGLPGVDNGMLRFDHVQVPREDLLDAYGQVDAEGVYSSPIESLGRRFFTMLGTLVRGRVSVGGGAAQSARAALSIATRHALTRRQFERPGTGEEVVLLDYRAHQRRLLAPIAQAYAWAFAQGELVARMHEVQSAAGPSESEAHSRAQRELEARAAGLKAAQTAWANGVLQTCREACGGAGYMAEAGLTRRRADADVFATFEGDNVVLLQLVAKGLLTDYRQYWGDLDTVGMVRAAASTFTGAVIERTAARGLVSRLVDMAQRRDPDDAVRDRGWQLALFEDRERHLVETLARRLRRGAGGDESRAFEVFNDAQDHLLEAARAHVDRITLEAFVAGIEGCEDPAARATLERLCDLYALSVVEASRAWLLEHQRLTPARAKAVQAAVDELCAELRPDALALVEGFGIPVEWLGSHLARPQA